MTVQSTGSIFYPTVVAGKLLERSKWTSYISETTSEIIDR